MSQQPGLSWLGPADTSWGVPVLDVRPFTLQMLSTSVDRSHAENAVSFLNDDGASFIGVEPMVSRKVVTNLRFPIDRMLADGVLFVPTMMEHKWALFYHRGQILCIRSWSRQVQAVADVRAEGDHVEIAAIRGTFVGETEPTFTVRVFQYLLRSHALDEVYPAPLPVEMERNSGAAAIWCFSCFGNRAFFATPHEFTAAPPVRPLRTDSLLHIAVARGDGDATTAYLDAGSPVDLLARDGLAPLHWAVARKDTAMLRLLIERGSPVDVRSEEDATPLMNAAQARSAEKVAFLLDHGADANAADKRGFTALHRAAEMGEIETVKLLLNAGATPMPEAQGHTPRSLAATRNEAAIVGLLDTWQRRH